METPYSKELAELAKLVEEGRQILSRLAESQKLKGKVDIGTGFAKQFKLARDENIGYVGRGIKAVAAADESLVVVESAKWYSRLADVIRGLHTGRRRCEISEGGKAKFLRDLAAVGASKSLKTRMSRGIAIASRISLEVSGKNAAWIPRGKVIASGRLLKGREEVEKILAEEMVQYVKVCDPHISPTTLSMLEVVPKGIPISVLTVRVHDSIRVSEYLKTIRLKRTEIKVAVKTEKPQPHDRYLLTSGKAWIVGTSLKDIGNRDSLIHELSNRSEVEQMIDEYITEKRGPVRWL